jgi:hypothetical protein
MDIIELKQKIVEKCNRPIDTDSLRELVEWKISVVDSFDEIFNEWQPKIMFCGCLGRQNNFSMCPCSLNRLSSRYMFEIGLYVLENGIEIIDKSEQRELERLEFIEKYVNLPMKKI